MVTISAHRSPTVKRLNIFISSLLQCFEQDFSEPASPQKRCQFVRLRFAYFDSKENQLLVLCIHLICQLHCWFNKNLHRYLFTRAADSVLRHRRPGHPVTIMVLSKWRSLGKKGIFLIIFWHFSDGICDQTWCLECKRKCKTHPQQFHDTLTTHLPSLNSVSAKKKVVQPY